MGIRLQPRRHRHHPVDLLLGLDELLPFLDGESAQQVIDPRPGTLVEIGSLAHMLPLMRECPPQCAFGCR